MTDHAILILAAGASRRMRGADKLLEPVDGTPVLRRLAQEAVATGARVLVTLPPDRPDRAAALEGLPLQRVTVPDADEGMAASIRAGIAALPDAVQAAAMCPADMPEITRAAFDTVFAAARAHPGQVIRAAAWDGTPGHPVLFPADCFAALRALRGDGGARPVLRANAHRLKAVTLAGAAAITDLDTPEAWADWRRRTGRPT